MVFQDHAERSEVPDLETKLRLRAQNAFAVAPGARGGRDALVVLRRERHLHARSAAALPARHAGDRTSTSRSTSTSPARPSAPWRWAANTPIRRCKWMRPARSSSSATSPSSSARSSRARRCWRSPASPPRTAISSFRIVDGVAVARRVPRRPGVLLRRPALRAAASSRAIRRSRQRRRACRSCCPALGCAGGDAAALLLRAAHRRADRHRHLRHLALAPRALQLHRRADLGAAGRERRLCRLVRDRAMDRAHQARADRPAHGDRAA